MLFLYIKGDLHFKLKPQNIESMNICEGTQKYVVVIKQEETCEDDPNFPLWQFCSIPHLFLKVMTKMEKTKRKPVLE